MTRPTKTSRHWKTRALLLSLVLAMSCSSSGLPDRLLDTSRPPAVASGVLPDLRVGTYNIYFRTCELSQTGTVLRHMDADVVALQEVSKECEPCFAKDRELVREYPYRHFAPGLGLLSRFPLRNVRYEHSRRGINGFLFAEIDHPKRGRVQIANLHLDPLRLWSARDLARLPFQLRSQREIQRDELSQVFAQLKPGLPTILTGDFNRVTQDAVNKIKERGFTDSFAAVTRNPDNVSTLHFSPLGIKLGRRIDYVFHDRHFQTVQSRVFPGKPSDHDALVSGVAWSASVSPATPRLNAEPAPAATAGQPQPGE
ncbi:MAG: endonuclease/exonuclease/phosphatase family protein [Prosthecobacter sp.]